MIQLTRNVKGVEAYWSFTEAVKGEMRVFEAGRGELGLTFSIQVKERGGTVGRVSDYYSGGPGSNPGQHQ